ncbi:hypothetical protein ACFQ9X_54165 [Catenulispora yoronensis]
MIHLNDDKIPAGKIMDVFDGSGGGQTSLAGQKNVNVDKVSIGWIVSDGQKKIQLSAAQYKNQDADTVVNLIKSQGFTKVQKLPGDANSGQQPNTVIKVDPGDGQYTADQQIIVYYAPQPPAPPSTSSSSQGCDPTQQDCSQPPTQPTGGQTTPPGQPTSSATCQFGAVLGCPSSPTSTKKGGG